MGTTRADSPGCRAPRRTTSGRSAVSARTASSSAAKCALADQKSNRASASSVSRRNGALVPTTAESSSRIRSISAFSATCASRQALPSSTDDERLDEQRLAAARGVVDDALDPGAGVGPDWDHVAPVAERDDRLLERRAELGADEGVEAPAEAVVGDPDRRPEAAQPR